MYCVWLIMVFWLCQRGNCSMCTSKQSLTNVQHGKMFEGHQMLNVSSEGIMQCSTFCMYRKICKSFNYNTVTGECQLNTNSTTDVTSLTPDNDFIFSDISTWPARLAGACEYHLCPLNAACDPVDDIWFNCVAEYCLGVPSVPNGVAKSSYHISPLRTILDVTCNHGYLPQDDIVCQNHGEWSYSQVCVALTSCSMVKQLQPASEDGEYWLFLTTAMYLSRIYCHGMSTWAPLEFLSLRNLNYGIYPLISTFDCTHETELSAYCLGEGGEIWFSKINVEDQGIAVSVMETDFTFANTSGQPDAQYYWYDTDTQYYGFAVDCYTEHPNYELGCGVKGKFTIDLRGTGWRVREGQQWETFGSDPFMHQPKIELNGTLIQLNCGGFSGGCRPEGGLSLTPYPDGLIR